MGDVDVRHAKVMRRGVLFAPRLQNQRTADERLLTLLLLLLLLLLLFVVVVVVVVVVLL